MWLPKPAKMAALAMDSTFKFDLLHCMGWTIRGSNLGGGRDFPHPSRPPLGSTRPPVQWVPAVFPVGNSAEAWRSPPMPL
jgi:hypothetical protein